MMRTKVPLRSLLLCLSAVLICNAALYWLSDVELKSKVRQVMQEHLAAAYDASLFSDDKGRVNDTVSIAYIGSQINNQTANWPKARWYSALKLSSVTINSIDGVSIGGPAAQPGRQVDSFIQLLRNKQQRTVSISYSWRLRWPVYGVLTAVVVLLYLILSSSLPTPLTAEQYRWSRALVQANYGPTTAHNLVATWRDDQLNIQGRRREIFDLVHDPAKGNFHIALQSALDPRAASLTDLDIEWLAATLTASGDIQLAWQAATHSDCVEIDLFNALLGIRGRLIEVTKTPLFYYAWYASKRLDGDVNGGWMLNPPSNRPDKELGTELSELMWKYKGHARAISELEEHGLRAKSLDQNRSKIKEELGAALGPKLAEHYLFDIDKDEQGRLRYRLKVQPAKIRILKVAQSAAGLLV